MVFPPVLYGGSPLVLLLFTIHTLETLAKSSKTPNREAGPSLGRVRQCGPVLFRSPADAPTPSRAASSSACRSGPRAPRTDDLSHRRHCILMAHLPASFNIRKPALDALDAGSPCFENGSCRAVGCQGIGSHGLMICTPVGSKSATLHVTIGMAWVIPVAAIRASRSLRGSGTCKAAQQSATGPSTGRIRSSKTGSTRSDIQTLKAAPCVLSRLSICLTPISSSKMVMTDKSSADGS